MLKEGIFLTDWYSVELAGGASSLSSELGHHRLKLNSEEVLLFLNLYLIRQVN